MTVIGVPLEGGTGPTGRLVATNARVEKGVASQVTFTFQPSTGTNVGPAFYRPDTRYLFLANASVVVTALDGVTKTTFISPATVVDAFKTPLA